MGKILEAFANDNILPCTRYFDQNSEYGRALDQLVSTEKSIRDSLDDTTKALFQKASDIQGKLNALSATDSFCFGFRLGILMLVEAFTERDDLILQDDDK